jgi:uncharacterized protein YutE (UPF0331/DUF86 family)
MGKRPLLDHPDQVTQSASDFYGHHFTNIMTYSMSEMLFEEHERFVTSTGRALSTDDKTPREVFPEAFDVLDYMRGQINNTRPARLEMALARSVDNFLSYVSDVLTQAITTRPDLLKTQEQVTLEEVLRHESLEDFVRWAAERRVNQLSFKGLTDIAEYVEKRLGLTLRTTDEDWQSLGEAVAVRNIVVHRRAIVDERFLWTVKGAEAQLTPGQKFSVPRELLAETMKCTMRMVRGFDMRVAAKFDLPLLSSSEQDWQKSLKAELNENAAEN